MTLTTEQHAILANVIADPVAWAEHAESTVGEQAVLDKVEKYRTKWLAEKDSAGYMTRAERRPK